MEIERKFLVNTKQLPFQPEDYPCRHIEQGYLCTAPVVRIRRDNDEYFLTYKSKGLMSREEYNHKRGLRTSGAENRRKDHQKKTLCHPIGERSLSGTGLF